MLSSSNVMFERRPDFCTDDLRTRRAAYALYKLRPALFAKTIPIKDLLVGGVERKSAATHARLIGKPALPSTRIADSPYAQLLIDYSARGDVILLPQFFTSTAYWQHALDCIRHYGQYCSHTDLPGVTAKASRFIAMFNGTRVTSNNPHETPAGSPVEVRHIAHSHCYETVDGHHRLAIAWKSGQTLCRCTVLPTEPALTPVQMMVMDSLWMFGKRRLLQPLPFPELSDWPVARRCDDRMRMIDAWITGHGMNAGTFLDVGCGYGWFLAEMRKRGYQVTGIERDSAIVDIGILAYGLRNQIRIGDAAIILGEFDEPYDAVCCLGVLDAVNPVTNSLPSANILRSLDRLTKHVLFLDTGPYGSRNSPSQLPAIEALLRENSSFIHIDVLGADCDRGHYRQLLACYR